MTTARLKQYARKAQAASVADAATVADLIRRDLDAAASAVYCAQDDNDEFFDSDDPEQQLRKSTGIRGLDLALNGGWGAKECYLLFGGTSSGKSIVAGQCGWHECLQGGWPLIVSTELSTAEYYARSVSNACSIDISHVQDCTNVAQIRMSVSRHAPGKLGMVEDTLRTMQQRMRIAKVRPEDGMQAGEILKRETDRFYKKKNYLPTWVCLDWLGTMADINPGAKGGTSERALAWEYAANSCVRFADESGIPTLVLAQAVNDAQLKPYLTINDIGISKGIGKNMVACIGVTNTIDKDGMKAAMLGNAEIPRNMIRPDQLFCMAKARKGETNPIRVQRDFKYQRFIVPK